MTAPQFRMRLKMWGVRGSTPTPQPENMRYGGNTPCLEVRLPSGEIFIFDAGTGARKLGQSLLEEAKGNPVDINFFLTHFHWDHIQGIPFFEPLYDPRNHICFRSHSRTGPLRSILEGQMKHPYFPVSFENAAQNREFEELSDESWNCSAFRVTPFALHHPHGSTGYRMEADGAVVVYATDHEHGNPDRDRVLRKFAQSADLLIYDSQYTPEEYESRRGWGHSTWSEALAVASDAQVKQVALFHHDPGHDDSDLDSILAHAQRQRPTTVMAQEGWTLEL